MNGHRPAETVPAEALPLEEALRTIGAALDAHRRVRQAQIGVGPDGT